MATKKEKTKSKVEASPIGAGPSKAVLALTTTSAAVPKGLVRRNMPKLIKPDQVPVGSTITGKIIGVFASPTKTVKGLLLHIQHTSGAEYTFPATGQIRQALAPGFGNEDEGLRPALEKFVGKTFAATRLDDGETRKFAKDGEPAKKMYSFDVFTD